MNITCILGSPSETSRSAALLHYAQSLLEPHATQVHTVSVRDLPAQALLHARFGDPALVAAIRKVEDAQLVLVCTPIYKAAYSGVLKSFLDLLPQDGLRGKTVLPLATGGSVAHLLAVDYALKPVLSALGARHVLDGVFASDAQIAKVDGRGYVVGDEIASRIARALREVIRSQTNAIAATREATHAADSSDACPA